MIHRLNLNHIRICFISNWFFTVYNNHVTDIISETESTPSFPSRQMKTLPSTKEITTGFGFVLWNEYQFWNVFMVYDVIVSRVETVYLKSKSRKYSFEVTKYSQREFCFKSIRSIILKYSFENTMNLTHELISLANRSVIEFQYDSFVISLYFS